MPTPALTHIQFAVIEALGDQERFGKEIRKYLRKRGIRQSLASFYLLMKRMEVVGLIDGRYTSASVRTSQWQQRCYKVLRAGFKARDEVLHWYRRINQ